MEALNQLVFPPTSHIGYIVDCIEDNAEAFAGLYGIESFDIYMFEPLHVWAYGKEIYDCRFCIAMGTPKNGINIELIQPISGCSTPQMEFLKRCGSGIHHFSFSVKNIDEWKAHFIELPKANIIFEAEAYDEKHGYRRCIYVQMDKTCPIVEFLEVPRKLPTESVRNILCK